MDDADVEVGRDNVDVEVGRDDALVAVSLEGPPGWRGGNTDSDGGGMVEADRIHAFESVGAPASGMVSPSRPAVRGRRRWCPGGSPSPATRCLLG